MWKQMGQERGEVGWGRGKCSTDKDSICKNLEVNCGELQILKYRAH